MQLILMGAVAIIGLIVLVAVAIRHARSKPSAVADLYDELNSESGGQIVARRLGEDTDADRSEATAGTEVVADRLLEPPEWPEALSPRRAERAGVD